MSKEQLEFLKSLQSDLRNVQTQINKTLMDIANSDTEYQKQKELVGASNASH